MQIEYKGSISVADYNHLRRSAGWTEIEPVQAQTGIHNSSILIAAYDSDTCVGCLRVISDGGDIAIIVDVLVLPAYQNMGIGREMMSRALQAIKEPLTAGQRVMVNLMSAKDKEPFYEKFGFEARPSSEYGSGMIRYLEGRHA